MERIDIYISLLFVYLSCIYLKNNLDMIIAKNIKKSFGNLQVLNDINLNVEKGEVISIVKTT